MLGQRLLVAEEGTGGASSIVSLILETPPYKLVYESRKELFVMIDHKHHRVKVEAMSNSFKIEGIHISRHYNVC